MKYSILALTALLIPPQAMMIQACDTTSQGILSLAAEEAHCHPWPSCTDWTSADTIKPAKALKARSIKARNDTVDVLVGEYDLASSGEFARLYLERGKIYRVEVVSRGGIVQIRPRHFTTQSALPLTIEDIPRASGTRALEIAPRQDGEYEFRVAGATGVGARIQIFREARSSARWQRLSARGSRT
jgi:hypothetical protein